MKKLKRTILMAAAVILAIPVFAQEDVITKHNGETVKGTVLRVDEYTITFNYLGESTEYTLSKYAIEKILHGKSGRVEKITDKIVVNGEDDWDKVIILEEKSYIAGLTKVSEIRGKTAYINFQTGNTGDKKAAKKLKMEAAALKCPFVYIISDKATVGSKSNEIGGSQSIKTGFAYRY